MGKILDAFGISEPWRRRSGWAWELKMAGLGDRPLIIANVHRAGRTRQSMQSSRTVRDLLGYLVLRANARLIVESHPDDRWLRDWLTLDLTASAVPPPGIDTARGEAAVRALACAELRRTPIQVWSELARAMGAESTTEGELLALAGQLPEILEVDAGHVRFVDERIAEVLRQETSAEDSRRIHTQLVSRLIALTGELPTDEGWEATGPLGQYAAQALPMHAFHADVLDEVLFNGRLAAHIDQVALLDAANCRDSVMPAATPAADAAALWASGVSSLSQPEWASWLHLMSTVRGDTETAREIELSGIRLPWRVRWAHWRPPYGWLSKYLWPGPLREIAEIQLDGYKAVAGKGQWDTRVRLWNAATGELLAGPWSNGVPAPGQSEPIWPRGKDVELMQSWLELTPYGGGAVPLLTETLRTDDLVILAGVGGVLAVEPHDPPAFTKLEQTYGEPVLGRFGLVDSGALEAWFTPQGAVLEALFERQAVQRLGAADLPAGLQSEDARHTLCKVGLPAFVGAGIRLVAVTEDGITELTAEDVWGEDDGSGAYYQLGTWWDGPVVFNGEDGTVHRLPAEDEDEAETVVATSLSNFVAMLQVYVLGRCLFPMASSRIEREDIRDDIDNALTAIDEEGGSHPAWSYGLWEND
ncbi:SUKH-4 family immunity protein [Streptomyces sp. NPDC004393]